VAALKRPARFEADELKQNKTPHIHTLNMIAHCLAIVVQIIRLGIDSAVALFLLNTSHENDIVDIGGAGRENDEFPDVLPTISGVVQSNLSTSVLTRELSVKLPMKRDLTSVYKFIRILNPLHSFADARCYYGLHSRYRLANIVVSVKATVKPNKCTMAQASACSALRLRCIPSEHDDAAFGTILTPSQLLRKDSAAFDVHLDDYVRVLDTQHDTGWRSLYDNDDAVGVVCLHLMADQRVAIHVGVITFSIRVEAQVSLETSSNDTEPLPIGSRLLADAWYEDFARRELSRC